MAEYGDDGVRYDPPNCACTDCITGKSLPDRRSGEQAMTVRWRSGLEQRGRVRTEKVEALCWCWGSPCACDEQPEAGR